MDFEEFYYKHIKEKSGDLEDSYKFSKEGYERMKKSRDPLHNRIHIDNLFTSLDRFLKENKKIESKINLNILFMSICWHDTWKARLNPGSVLAVAYAQATEGIRSYIIFHREVKKYNLDKQLVKDVGYAIRKHSSVQILKTKTLEAKILQDLDKLEALNFERIIYAFKNNFRLNKKRHIFLTKLYISKISRNDYYFNWTKHLLFKKRKEFLKKFERYFKN